MPNLRLSIDRDAPADVRARLAAGLVDVRAILIDRLPAERAACQLAVVEVAALPDQPGINAELFVLPNAQRTRARLEEVGAALRDHLHALTGLTVAVRIAHLDPDTYVAVR